MRSRTIGSAAMTAASLIGMRSPVAFASNGSAINTQDHTDWCGSHRTWKLAGRAATGLEPDGAEGHRIENRLCRCSLVFKATWTGIGPGALVLDRYHPWHGYYGLVMLHHWITPGDTLVNSTTTDLDVVAHAATTKRQGVSVLLENESPLSSHGVAVSITGDTRNSQATVYTYVAHSEKPTMSSLQVIRGQFHVTLPPYTMATVVLK